MMQIFLLTHPREVGKVTNTGRLVNRALSVGNSENVSAQILLWSRTQANPLLLDSIETTSTLLLYPSEEALLSPSEDSSNLEQQQLMSRVIPAQNAVEDVTSFIILDGTWQQARKIYNKSPYLKDLKRLHLAAKTPSRYSLRRNQKTSGLCTAESVIELLKLKRCLKSADAVDTLYSQFLIEMQADKKQH